MKSTEEYVDGYKKNDEVYVILIDSINQAKMCKGTVVGDVSYKYEYSTLAIHTEDMEDEDDWVEVDTDFIAHTKSELLDKLKKVIDLFENLYKHEIMKGE